MNLDSINYINRADEIKDMVITTIVTGKEGQKRIQISIRGIKA